MPWIRRIVYNVNDTTAVSSEASQPPLTIGLCQLTIEERNWLNFHMIYLTHIAFPTAFRSAIETVLLAALTLLGMLHRCCL